MRKQIIFFYLFLFALNNTNAQINILTQNSVSDKVSTTVVANDVVYDSLVNVQYRTDGKNNSYKWLQGQELIYLCSDIEENNSNNIQFSRITNEKNECIDDRQLIGHSFILKNVVPNRSGYGEMWHIQEKTNNTLYIYSASLTSSIDNKNWICQGYYDRIKKTCIGKNFIYISSSFASAQLGYGANKLFDFNTNEQFTPADKSVWKCVDIGVLPRSSSIFKKVSRDKNATILIFEDSSGKRAYQFLTDKKGNTYSEHMENHNDKTELFLSCFMDESFYHDYLNGKTPAQLEAKAKKAEEDKKVEARLAQLTKKYGKANATRMIRREVVIGWSKAMCEESWGTPARINTSTYSWGVKEQWCYNSGNYLYFTNGKLTAIQN